jgi:hypothetical protein
LTLRSLLQLEQVVRSIGPLPSYRKSLKESGLFKYTRSLRERDGSKLAARLIHPSCESKGLQAFEDPVLWGSGARYYRIFKSGS